MKSVTIRGIKHHHLVLISLFQGILSSLGSCQRQTTREKTYSQYKSRDRSKKKGATLEKNATSTYWSDCLWALKSLNKLAWMERVKKIICNCLPWRLMTYDLLLRPFFERFFIWKHLLTELKLIPAHHSTVCIPVSAENQSHSRV